MPIGTPDSTSTTSGNATAVQHGRPRPTRQSGRKSIKTMVASDRKSVVVGKSVSVRVDHSGRRIIHKKTHQKTSRIILINLILYSLTTSPPTNIILPNNPHT